jgi:hypothetical protein
MGSSNTDSRGQTKHIEGQLTFLGAAQYTGVSTSSPQQLTSVPNSGIAAPSNARVALIQAEAQNIRWTGGTTLNFTLSSSVGMILSTAMDHLVYNAVVDESGDPQWGNFQFIGTIAGAIVNVQYFH